MQVLVIAPRFPSVNQPWIDTYLEQLLKNGLTIRVFSSSRPPGVYQEKVDRLGLRQFVLDFSIEPGDTYRCLLNKALRSPITFIRSLFFSVGLAQEFVDVEGSWPKALIKTVNFMNNKDLFSTTTVIHAHSEWAGYEFLYLKAQQNVPMILTFHGLPPAGVPHLSSAKRQLLYEMVDMVVVNTRFAKQQVLDLGCSENKIRIIPQGLPTEEYEFQTRMAPKFETEPLKLLSVGRFQREKGHRYAIIAVKRLVDRGISVSYDIAGVGDDFVKLKKLCLKLGIGTNVRFHKDLQSKDIRALLKAAHLFILPSIQTSNASCIETQGVAIQEAQASGCIPIVTHVGGVPECVHNGFDAILIRDKSSKAIVAAIDRLLEAPDRWPELQHAGRRNVEENFSADVVGREIYKLLNDTVNICKTKHLVKSAS